MTREDVVAQVRQIGESIIKNAEDIVGNQVYAIAVYRGAKMSYLLGAEYECARCGKTVFTPISDAHMVTNIAKQLITPQRPDDWKFHPETGDLCPDCEKAFQEAVDEFFEG